MTEPIRVGATTSPTSPQTDEAASLVDTFTIEVADKPVTVLADVRAEMADDPDVPTIKLAVPNRPKYMVEYRPEFGYDLLRLWLKRARGKGKADDTHMLQLAWNVLTHCCVGIWRDGQLLTGRSGNPFTFTSAEWYEIQGLSLPSPQNSIRKLYGKGSDGHILMVMRRVSEEAGYSEEIDLEMGETGPLDD